MTLFKFSRFSALLFACMPILLSQHLAGQMEEAAKTTDPGPFYGFWEFQEPAGDSCIVIIKRGGRISCFWAGTASRAIQKGNWERDGDTLTAQWDTGNLDVFKMLGENAIERDSYLKGATQQEEPLLSIRGVRVDSRVPGSLTIKREGDREPITDIPDPQSAPAIAMNNTYVGFWKVQQSTGIFGIGGGEPHYYLQLSRSGQAAVALRDWEGGKGVRGKWTMDADRVVVTWPNRRRDVLYPNTGVGYTLATYRPKDDLDDKPQDRAKAEKVTAADAERYFEAGNFKRLTVLDIRGTWVPAESTGTREYISIEGWGNAYRFPAVDSGGGTDPGKWRLESNRVVITWVDGSKDIIRIAFPRFVQDSYDIDEPITGKPSRSIEVNRSVEEK